VLALLGGAAQASVPDPDYCTVTDGATGGPDNMSIPRLAGIPSDPIFRADGEIVIYAAAYGGTPIADAEVTIVINAACEMCICDSWVSTAYTDVTGYVTMSLRWGGCCEMTAAATIYIDGTPIRSYDVINSSDYNSSGTPTADCRVNLEDFGEFAGSYGASGDTAPCSDFTGDGLVNLEDFGFFAGTYGDLCVTTP
jgi:hypothetical protein